MKKKIENFRVGMLKNYKNSVEALLRKYQGFYFMNQYQKHQVIGKSSSMKF